MVNTQDQELISYLKTNCRPTDENDDALIYKIDKVMKGRFQSLKTTAADHIFLYDDDTYTLEALGSQDLKSGALLREFRPAEV